MPPRKFVQVQRQIFLRDVVIGANDATLEQGPKGFDALSVNLATHVLALAMAHNFTTHVRIKQPIAGVFVGCDQLHFVSADFTDETIQCRGVGVLDHLTDNIALPADSANHCCLAGRTARAWNLLIPVAVTIFAANERFIDFDLAHQVRKLIVLQHRADTMADVESSLVGGGPAIFLKLALNLKGTHTLLALAHEVNNLKPNRQRVIGVLEYCGDQWRETIAVFLIANGFLAVRASPFLAALADPIPSAGFQPEHLVIAAARALHPRRPPQTGEQFHALVLGTELFMKLSEAQHKQTLHLVVVGVKSVIVPLGKGSVA